MMRRLMILLAPLLHACSCDPAKPPPPPSDAKPEIRIGDAPLRIEISSKDDQRMRGLMKRESLGADDGMLFVYANPHPLGFWMGHCYIPLDIAFFDADGRLLNVVEMKTYPNPDVDTGERAHSLGDAKYVVETNIGWFRRKKLTGPDGLPSSPVRLKMPPDVEKIVREAD